MLSVGWQLRQCAARVGAGPAEIVAALEQVGLEAQPVLRQHAGQLSGGMQQRVLIAMALLLRPQLVWADEPTSSLDSDTAAEVLQALALMQQQTGCALVLITHDLRIVAQHCEQIAVLDPLRDPQPPWPPEPEKTNLPLSMSDSSRMGTR